MADAEPEVNAQPAVLCYAVIGGKNYDFGFPCQIMAVEKESPRAVTGRYLLDQLGSRSHSIGGTRITEEAPARWGGTTRKDTGLVRVDRAQVLNTFPDYETAHAKYVEAVKLVSHEALKPFIDMDALVPAQQAEAKAKAAFLDAKANFDVAEAKVRSLMAAAENARRNAIRVALGAEPWPN